ncbi:hypothetical protein ElP_01810 [Tautonia plasticadhaerens]|uniref:Uncharacterized protein n=1 Tax=Tautonia plasticadhaerens TaxID=2527974 RepID=A0A518GUT9_9BACT|nr:hypothetical protein ElP_01810 [Tautonia plasticadhaerens]
MLRRLLAKPLEAGQARGDPPTMESDEPDLRPRENRVSRSKAGQPPWARPRPMRAT